MEKKRNSLSSIYKKWRENSHMFAEAKHKQYHKPEADVALSVQHLSMIFKIAPQTYKKAVDDLSFDVKKGQFHGFVGNNGSGKTTTIRSILGFYPGLFGKIFINGLEFTNSSAKRKIGYIPEVTIFPKNLSAIEYIYSLALMSGVDKKVIKDRINYIMDTYGFHVPDMSKSPAYMSSGQKKSIMLIQALINDPEILILDEPAANLDPSSRIKLFNTLKQLHLEGKTIFISSHILDELEKYIDSFTLLSEGKLLYSGSINDLEIEDNNFNTKVKVNNNMPLRPYLEANNIDFYIENDIVFCNLKTNEDKANLVKEILKLNLEIISITKNTQPLISRFFEKSAS
ncbi:ABC transporter, ATP-binding protein [Mycoplasmopsis agalactiae 14628]|uniref:ABC transporter, ATP-binding protein n=1 Tax=Mycoplasmopsis agalactiae 14628 TaxID=1110504 RepID=I5D596_MYCAA|nr:ABC transporter ATP-binding protein [Mycoplasmopsis agalactiae]EIN14855.1 ABC transporter, ATP-binding protein [Mycoplasmopsis agalactiae 14628]